MVKNGKTYTWRRIMSDLVMNVKPNKKECFKDFCRYSTLSVLGILGVSCYILADTFFVSKGLGTDGLTALNLAIPAYNFIYGTGLMLGMGGATKFSIFRSQGEAHSANKVFTNTIYLAVFFSVFYVLLGMFGAENLADLLGAKSGTEVFAMTVTYLRWLLIFAPAFILNNIFLCFMRNDEAPQLAMTAQLVGSFSNIVLDYVFIFPLGMGIFGAILATGFSPVISMIIMLPHKLKKKTTFHLTKTTLDKNIVWQELSIGFPSFVTEISLAIVMIIFNLLILRLEGNTGVAAYGVIANISLVIVAIYTGLGQGIQPLVSDAYGRDERMYIKQILSYAIKTMILLSVIIYTVLVVFVGPIVAIFNSEGNETMQSIAEEGMKLYFTSNLFVGFNIILATYFSSTERNIPAHILTLLRGLVLIIPLSFFMSFLWEMKGIWLAYPTAELVTAIIGLALYIRCDRMWNQKG